MELAHAPLQRASRVVSYNGNTFDVPVLRKHGLKGKFPLHGDHIDLREAGLDGGLHKWALSELDERKLPAGKSLESLQKACQHGVFLTWQLWELYESESFDFQQPSPGHPPLEQANFEDLSDGEIAEVIALEEGGGDEAWLKDML